MSFLDIYDRDQRHAAGPQTGEQARLPATYSDAFDASWSNAYLWGQSIAGHNSRDAAIDDYADETQRKSGENIRVMDPSGFVDLEATRAKADELRGKRPDLNLGALTDDEIDQRAVKKSQTARTDYADMAQREKTLGGKVGSLLGGLAGAATDPVNILALPVAPAEGLGLLATAARWAMIGGGAQVGIEVLRAPFAEKVQPGYSQSGEPAANILEAAGGAAVLGGGLKFLGNAWTRMKTGEWPQSIRDAGNIAESEANVLNTNVLRGAEGETAHREALSKAIDDLVAGRQPDVAPILETKSSSAGQYREAYHGTPHAFDQFDSAKGPFYFTPDPKGAEGYATRGPWPKPEDTPNIRPAHLKMERPYEISLNDAEARMNARNPEWLRANGYDSAIMREVGDSGKTLSTEYIVLDKSQIVPRFSAEGQSIWAAHEARIDTMLDTREAANAATEAARMQRGASTELPFEATSLEARAEQHVGTLADGIQDMARQAGHMMPRDEAEALAARIAKAPEDEARQILQETALRPSTIADTLPSASAAAKERRAIAKTGEPMPAELQAELSPKRLEELRKDPELDETILRDLDRLRAEKGDIEIPVGEEIGPSGERVLKTRKIESVLDEADARMKAAKEIEACAGPQPEAEAGAAESGPQRSLYNHTKGTGPYG